MKKEKISKVIGEIAEHHIEEALKYENEKYTPFGHWTIFQKAVACIALIIITLIGSTSIAFAANKDFRNVVINLFGFSKEEKNEIENGHLTGKLDKTDTLLTFLDEFNAKDMGNGKKVKYDAGYDYTFLRDNGENVNAVVVCESDKYWLLVTMKQESIAEGVIGWYVASYQIISSKQAEELIMSYSQNPENAERTENEQGNVDYNTIKANNIQGKIYNALHKEEENIISLTEEETQDMKKIFDSYKHDDNEYGDDELCKYIILFNNSKYMMTENGFVIGEKENKSIIFKLSTEDLEKVMSLFQKYKIPD